MDYEFIKVTEKEKVVELVLSRPDVLNALNIPMLKEIAAALSDITKSRQGILVLRGEGRSFCVGADISERRQGLSLETYLMERVLTLQRIASLLRNMEGVTIVALHGNVIGAGLVMSLYADIRIATDDATFRLPEVDVGSTILCGGYKVLIENVGLARAKEFLLLGEPIGAADAERFNLIHKKVPTEKLEETITRYVDKLADKPPLAKRLIKRSMVQALEKGFGEMLLQEVVDAARNHYKEGGLDA